MSRTSYCKKCACDVPVGEVCPNCGGKLAANAVRLSWCVDHAPLRDWMCWNAVMRIVLPAFGVTLALTVLLELLLSGPAGVALMLSGGVLVCLAGILGLILSVMLLLFILQGDDVLDCVIDSQGLHVTQYLQEPTAMKLLLRGKSPSLAQGIPEGEFLCIGQKEIGWKALRRVQLWPEKCTILLYGAPVWWMRLSLPCTPFTWPDALDLIREKAGKRKDVLLPEECRQAAPPKGKKAASPAKKSEPFEGGYLPPQPIPEEDVPPEWQH